MEFHSEAAGIQQIFTSKWTSSKDFLIPWKSFWLRAVKKQHFSIFCANFQGLESNLSSWFFSYYNIELGEQRLLMTLLISFISKHGLFSKNVPNFWWLSIKQSYKISKNTFRRLIQMQKSIEFWLHHWEIPQLSSY